MSLSQVQIIRSLGEALAWFEKELAWNVEPAELRHLTGRIGELYAAMITRGQMALAVNQKGYDVVSAEGEHISVKTVTTSNVAVFNKNTYSHVDRVMVLRINVDEGEASIEEVFDGSAVEMRRLCNEGSDGFIYVVGKGTKAAKPVVDLAEVARATYQGKTVIQLENGTIQVEVEGELQAVAKPVLREICAELGINLLNSNDNKRNTRQLGALIIAALSV